MAKNEARLDGECDYLNGFRTWARIRRMQRQFAWFWAGMPNPNGDLIDGSLRLDSDRRLKLELLAGLAAYRELRSVT